MFLKLIIYCNLLILAVNAGEVDDKCRPNMEIEDGTCKLVADCEVALRLIKTLQSQPYSRCGFSGIYEIVCCPNQNDLKPPVSTLPTKFGAIGSRIADKACQYIVTTNLPPLGLYIIGGVEASKGEFPHMVALGYGGPDTYEFQCGASLLSKMYALTAAHCVDTLTQILPTIARMGVIDIGENTWNEKTDYRIAKILTHPNYLRRTKYHDLALIRMERSVNYVVGLSPVCLYTSMDDPKIPLTVTGWGQASTIRDLKSPILLKANVTVVPRDECRVSYTYWRKLPEGITAEQICAGDPQGLKDTCQGDSGGPLQGLGDRDGVYRLVGVTSFGRGCGSSIPGVYTRVAHYLDWIESVVWPMGFDTNWEDN